MTWSAARVRDLLREECQLYGLHLLEISAAYTSQQDSRTGAPGIRCSDIPVQEFLTSQFWRVKISHAQKRKQENKADPVDCLLLEAWDLVQARQGCPTPRVLRLPMDGGEIFVSADEKSPAAKGLHADLNAAANIGLKALMDPDWPGKWWYVPCNATNGTPDKKCSGSDALDPTKPLVRILDPQPLATKRSRSPRNAQVMNFWCDISHSPLQGDPVSSGRQWRESRAYWGDVRERVVKILRQRLVASFSGS